MMSKYIQGKNSDGQLVCAMRHLYEVNGVEWVYVEIAHPRSGMTVKAYPAPIIHVWEICNITPEEAETDVLEG